MGIKTPGQLGATQELEDSQNIFYTTVIQPKQFAIAKAFNKVLAYNELEEVSIEPIKIKFDVIGSTYPAGNNDAIGNRPSGGPTGSGDETGKVKTGGGTSGNIDKSIDS
jgi:hypothetical protein